ncbi:MAG TPA: formyltransferase family protein, partial [Azonexus sp.]|nr:formyltransferase family protein [Azonexus sp.]
MRILFVTHSFNSLAQRLYCELTRRGHQVNIEFDISDSVTEEAVALFKPDLVVAPFLKRAIPESVWSRVPCFVVHPGIPGDRGPSALDWAIQRGLGEWGVTVLQAEAEMDAGPVWASAGFPTAAVRKASLYRNQVTEAAVRAVLQAVDRFVAGDFVPQRVPGAAHALMKQDDRAIDWQADPAALVLAKLNAADGFPGVADQLFGQPCHLFDAWPEATLTGQPGELIGRREAAICRATVDGAVWVGHVKRSGGVKLPATMAFPESAALPELPLAGWWKAETPTWQDIAYEEAGGVGFLSFEFYNGAMSSAQCRRLKEAFLWAAERPTKVIVLRGGSDFWSNGIHLNTIEAADSPADESWRNINAMDDLTRAIITTTGTYVISAMQGNG